MQDAYQVRCDLDVPPYLRKSFRRFVKAVAADAFEAGRREGGRETMNRLTGGGRRDPPDIQHIQRVVADRLGILESYIQSDRQGGQVSTARHIAMYLAREMTPLSLPMIGKAFGRDHSTVAYGIRRVEQRCKTDDKMGDLVAKIRAALHQ